MHILTLDFGSKLCASLKTHQSYVFLAHNLSQPLINRRLRHTLIMCCPPTVTLPVRKASAKIINDTIPLKPEI